MRSVRLGMMFLANSVRVVLNDGTTSEILFVARGRSRVTTALRDRGWPVVDGQRFSELFHFVAVDVMLARRHGRRPGTGTA